MYAAVFKTMRAALIAALGTVGVASAHDGHSHGGAQHGGVEASSQHHHFEAVFTNRGVTLYVHDAKHKAVDVSRLKATATFFHPNAPEKPWFTRELKAAEAKPGHPADSLTLAIDLSKAPKKGARATFQVAGFDDSPEREATVTMPISFTGDLVVTVATAADTKSIEQLKLCPVSQEELGSMGTPLKVTRGAETTYLCCKGCLKKFEATPDEFLSNSANKAAPKHEHHNR